MRPTIRDFVATSYMMEDEYWMLEELSRRMMTSKSKVIRQLIRDEATRRNINVQEEVCNG
jgi:hypothetical protein